MAEIKKSPLFDFNYLDQFLEVSQALYGVEERGQVSYSSYVSNVALL